MIRRFIADKVISLLLLALAPFLSISNAVACETVEYKPSPSELRKDAVGFFDQEAVVYEGMLLGSHDSTNGGKFLVLKSYKGPATAFDVIDLPGGSSCYSGVSSFSMGLLTNYTGEWDSFDGLVSDEYVNVWKERRLVERGLRSPVSLLKFSAALVPILFMCLIIMWFYQRRKNRAV